MSLRFIDMKILKDRCLQGKTSFKKRVTMTFFSHIPNSYTS